MGNPKEREWQEIISALAETDSTAPFVAMHNLFGQLVSGGFTSDQSLRIIAYGMFQQEEEGDSDE